jgi:hypothetical protein
MFLLPRETVSQCHPEAIAEGSLALVSGMKREILRLLAQNDIR